jgi:transcriptional regulator with XRE-family HTH domain
MIDKEYIEKLRQRLKVNLVTFGALARAMGVERTYISRIMNGRIKNPRLDTIVRIEEALGKLLNDR